MDHKCEKKRSVATAAQNTVTQWWRCLIALINLLVFFITFQLCALRYLLVSTRITNTIRKERVRRLIVRYIRNQDILFSRNCFLPTLTLDTLSSNKSVELQNHFKDPEIRFLRNRFHKPLPFLIEWSDLFILLVYPHFNTLYVIWCWKLIIYFTTCRVTGHNWHIETLNQLKI